MNTYLAHYGTPGMRWGHRKAIFTNASSGSDSARRLTSSIEKIAKKKKDLSKLSDDELKKRVLRLNLEQQYRNLSSVDKSRGAEKVRDILDVVGAVAGLGASAAAIITTTYYMKEKV